MSGSDELQQLDPIYPSVIDTYEVIDLNRGSCNDVVGRVRVDVKDVVSGRTAVILTFGQSNAANSGDAPYTPRGRVYNFNIFDGGCYVAKDPLLGATERKGNFAGRMADLLIDRGVFDSVVLVPIAVGGSRIEEWTTGGPRHRRLQIAVMRTRQAGLRLTHLLWHQGETNARHGPDGPVYEASFRNIHRSLRRYGVHAPILVAQATICGGGPVDSIRQAQRAVVDHAAGVFAGPDTDIIGSEDRFDGCHMAETGLIRHAGLWVDALIASGHLEAL